MKLSHTLFATAVAAGASFSANAVSFDLSMAIVSEDTAPAGFNTPNALDLGDTLAIVADIDGSGFANYSSLGPDSFLADSSDLLLAVFEVQGPGDGVVTLTTPGFDTNGIEGVQFAVLWFDTPFSAGIDAVGPGADVAYGFFTSTADAASLVGGPNFLDSQTNFFLPANNFAGQLSIVDSNFGGPVDPSQLTAQFVTVPEPASALLVLAGAGLMAARRRRA